MMEQILKPKLQAQGWNPPKWLGAVLFTLLQLELADRFFFPSLQARPPCHEHGSCRWPMRLGASGGSGRRCVLYGVVTCPGGLRTYADQIQSLRTTSGCWAWG